jgi:3-dehydroquinate synthase
MSTILVKTASANYPVLVQPRLLEKLASHVRQACGEQRSIFVVTSPEIWSRWGQLFLGSFSARKIDVLPLFVPAGERYKQLKTVEHLAEKMIVAGAKRDALLVAFGGGVAAFVMFRYRPRIFRKSTPPSAARPESIFVSAKTW